MSHVRWTITTLSACGLLSAVVAFAQDDHGDVSAEASLLQIGPPRPGRIDSSSDKDVFRLDLTGRAAIEIRTTGQTDTAGELLDSTGARIMADDDDGPGDNFSVSAELDPGIYYVEVSGSRGDYAINTRLAAAPDHGDTAESSTLLKLHTQEELLEVSPAVLLATAGRIWPATDDTDVFRIDVPADATMVTLRSSGSVDTWAALDDSSGNEIAFHDGDANFRIEQMLGAGIYYLKIHGHGVGAYRVLGVAEPGVAEEPGDAPDLVVESPSVDDDTPAAGASFTFSATVRNRGDGRSASTTLRYYRSSNSGISTSDTELGTDPVGGLAASATSAESIRLTAPSSAGTYYFGACVDSATGEASTNNNCSRGVAVEVSDGGRWRRRGLLLPRQAKSGQRYRVRHLHHGCRSGNRLVRAFLHPERSRRGRRLCNGPGRGAMADRRQRRNQNLRHPHDQRLLDHRRCGTRARGMNLGKTPLLLLAVAVVAAAVLVHRWQQGPRTFIDPTPSGTLIEAERMAATVARIAAESRDPETSPPAVRAAPVPARDSGSVAENADAPALPEGYAPVGFDGEMAKAPLGVLREDATATASAPTAYLASRSPASRRSPATRRTPTMAVRTCRPPRR